MNQKEWIEQFQSLNGRNPEFQEYATALKEGEFEIEKNISETTSDSGVMSKRRAKITSILKKVLLPILVLVVIGSGYVFWKNSVSSPFDKENFESGTWVILDVENGNETSFTDFDAATWNDFFNLKSGESFEYGQLDEYDSLATFYEEDGVENKLEASIQAIKGKDAKIKDNNFNVVTTDSAGSVLFYWVDSNTAFLYLPALREILVARKVTPNKGIAGDYKMMDYRYFGNDLLYEDDVEEQLEEALSEEQIVSFDGIEIPDSEGSKLMSYEEFIQLYQLSGGDLGQINGIDDINIKIKQAGYKIEHLKNSYVGIKYGRSFFESLSIFIPVESGEKIISLPVVTSESDYLEGTSGDARESYNSLLVFEKVNLKD